VFIGCAVKGLVHKRGYTAPELVRSTRYQSEHQWEATRTAEASGAEGRKGDFGDRCRP